MLGEDYESPLIPCPSYPDLTHFSHPAHLVPPLFPIYTISSRSYPILRKPSHPLLTLPPKLFNGNTSAHSRSNSPSPQHNKSAAQQVLNS